MARTLPSRMYRSRHDRVVGGVAAGIAAYFDVDPTVVRLLWILAAIFSGGAVLLIYLALVLIVPEEELVLPRRLRVGAGPEPTQAAEMPGERTECSDTGMSLPTDKGGTGAELTPEPLGTYVSLDEEIPAPERARRRVWGGIILVTLGLVFLGGNFGLYHWFRWDQYWPLALIGIGLLLLWSRWARREGMQ